MRLEILINNINSKWTIENGVYLTGTFFHEDKYINNHEMIEIILSWTEEELLDNLSKLNGSYAIIINKENKIYAVEDRIRSIPLLYYYNENEFIITNEAQCITNKINNLYLNNTAFEEFKYLGYVSGKETLAESLYQLRAGEILIVEQKGKLVNFTSSRYYKFSHGNFLKDSETEIIEKMDAEFLKVFKRMLESVQDRTLVVPLSGGYDSRLIVLMLKKLGYSKVITFTYGLEGNSEAKISKSVAERLGYKWIFVPYTNELWQKWYDTDQWKSYAEFANNFTSCPHLQDWPAVMELKEKEYIPEDSIFVPGHAGDFIAGSHIPSYYSTVDVVNQKNLMSDMLSYHYNLFNWNRNSILYNNFTNKILNIIGNENSYSPEDAADKLELWDWQERQAKFICNSIRVYEFWGFDWRLPFWDAELMEFFQRLPLDKRLGEKTYLRYVKVLWNRVLNENDSIDVEDSTPDKLKVFLKKVHLYDLSKIITYKIRKIRYKGAYYGNELAFYGIMPIEKFRKIYTGYENINSFIVLDTIEHIKKKLRNR